MTSTMLTIPMTMMGRVVIHEVRCSISVPPLAQQGQQQSAGDDRGYLARDVDTDGVHQQEILVVLLEAQLVDDASAHGEGRDAGCADHGVELLVCREEEVEQLGEKDAAGGVKDEGHEAQRKDEQGVGPDELVCRHLPGHRQAQHDGNKVGQYVLRSLGQSVQHAAHTAQRNSRRAEQGIEHKGVEPMVIPAPVPVACLVFRGKEHRVAHEFAVVQPRFGALPLLVVPVDHSRLL